MSDIIIVPDVHGRDFWKKDVLSSKDEKIIFLGDYLDPYEKVSEDELIDNFKQIIDFKVKNKDRVTLLIGNHDAHYSINCNKGSRYDFRVKNRLKKEGIDFLDDKNFEIIHEEEISGTKFVFTHAGVRKEWYESHFGKSDVIDCNKVKELFYSSPLEFTDTIGFLRGGMSMYGSPLWADIREYGINDSFENTIQIFGHTQLAQHPININDKVYCLDTRRCFLLKKDGKLMEMNENLNNNNLNCIRYDFKD